MVYIWICWASEEIQKHESDLKLRFDTALDIDGIQSHHSIVPSFPAAEVALRRNSNQDSFGVKKISTKEFELEFDDVSGFITFCYGQEWK